jgi:hypothetical protein
LFELDNVPAHFPARANLHDVHRAQRLLPRFGDEGAQFAQEDR